MRNVAGDVLQIVCPRAADDDGIVRRSQREGTGKNLDDALCPVQQDQNVAVQFNYRVPASTPLAQPNPLAMKEPIAFTDQGTDLFRPCQESRRFETAFAAFMSARSGAAASEHAHHLNPRDRKQPM